MNCPQCGNRVPADDAFCGKCGYAMRDQAPDRLDQSRIRVHEEPEPTSERQDETTPQQRIRKHTVLGMPSAKPSADRPKAPAPPAAAPPSAPTPIASAQRRSRVSQKTMLGIPRPDFPEPPAAPIDADVESAENAPSPERGAPVEQGVSQSHRARARVRYDSANEPFPVVQRRRRALGVLAVLIVLAASWLGYRFFTLHG